jgi:hypothetical protein
MKLNRSNETILRIVDDYLVICCDNDRLNKIYDLLKNEFNLNDKKTVKNLWEKPISCQKISKNKLNDSVLCLTVNQNERSTDSDIMEICDDQLLNPISFLSNCSNGYFSWCGLNFDQHTLDVYFNYDKYFDTESLTNRLNFTNDYHNMPYLLFNLKFLRLFSMSLTTLVLDNNKVNNLQSILRNFCDFYALSAIRFVLMYDSNIMPMQFKQNVQLQLKLILNLCYLSNNRISNQLKKELLNYFYSTFALFKFICLRIYSILINKFNLNKHFHLSNVINSCLKRLNFNQRCIKFNNQEYFYELNEIIEQQLQKFYKCKI